MSVKPIQIQNALTVNYCKKYGIISDLWPTISTQKSNPFHFETSYKLTYYFFLLYNNTHSIIADPLLLFMNLDQTKKENVYKFQYCFEPENK